MLSDRITENADWRDGISQFRVVITERIESLEAKIDMLLERIKWLEEPPKAPHTKIEMEDKL